jgi:ferredoxin--NADP+ reductase
MFVIVHATQHAERIPLTVAFCDREKKTITLIIQAVGASTNEICDLESGDTISDIAGPLGHATEIENVGHAVIVGGGVGTAVIYPQAKALKDKGNHVSAIIGGRSKPYVILEKELAAICDDVFPCTDDGSHGTHGFVTDRLKKLIAETDKPVKQVLCAGPVPMMRAVAEVTRPFGIHTIASLNPVMVDGTGMCGGCRVIIDGQPKFACVDGPEFDAHKVDFTSLTDRLRSYHAFEQKSSEKHACRLTAAVSHVAGAK